jgi:hypothetical protein
LVSAYSGAAHHCRARLSHPAPAVILFASRVMTKMETQVLGGMKDVVAMICAYSLALNLFSFESQIITGLFALGGVVLGRILDWSWESYKKRRDRRRSRKKLSH